MTEQKMVEVGATELVRNFAAWLDAVATGEIYGVQVMQHSRCRNVVLISRQEFQQLLLDRATVELIGREKATEMAQEDL